MTIPNQISATPLAAFDDRQRAGLFGRVRRALGTVLFGSRRAGAPSSERSSTFDTAAAAAALAQRITGSGSGPYSGTPFLPAPDDVGRTRTAGEPSEAERHDHGIIDHSRHVSSIGRR